MRSVPLTIRLLRAVRGVTYRRKQARSHRDCARYLAVGPECRTRSPQHAEDGQDRYALARRL